LSVKICANAAEKAYAKMIRRAAAKNRGITTQAGGIFSAFRLKAACELYKP